MQPDLQSIRAGTADASAGALAPDRLSVLRNTYKLLSMTLLFSCAMAFVGTVTHIGNGTGLVLMLVGLGLLFATMALRNSGWAILLVFAFTGIEGLSLGPILNQYLSMKNGGETIMMAGGLTAAVFLSLTAYTLISKKDFSFLGSFLFAGLIVLVLASLIGLFVGGVQFQLMLATAGALIFSGYILYDTSQIINGGQTNYVMATVSLYLDILNLFLDLLRLIGAARD
jgi:modulator of FtsH protease